MRVRLLAVGGSDFRRGPSNAAQSAYDVHRSAIRTILLIRSLT